MPFHRGMSSSVALPPAVATAAVQQFNQDRASFVCLVSANGYSSIVSFQYNTTNNWSSYTSVVASSVTGQGQIVNLNVTGLSVGTTYYVRAVVQSTIGTTIGGVVSFTTWSLKTYINSAAGAFSVSVPSITPIGGTALAPTIYEMLIYGGGGGANYSGGGGGGYRLAASKLSSSSGTQTVTGTVGSGGTGGNGGGGAGGATAGGSTTLTIGNTTYTATGGQPANWLTNGGASGSGDNTSKAGGNGNYGYTYISGYNQWTDPSCGCCATDKFGNCTAFCTCNNPNSPIYTTDYNRYAGGGGGGTDSAGGNATYPDGGGNGGTGGGAYGLRGGNGGRGGGTASFGTDGGTVGSGPVVGKGGSGWFDAGVAGGVTFKYYGP